LRACAFAQAQSGQFANIFSRKKKPDAKKAEDDMGCASSTDAASGKGSTREEDDVFEVRPLLLLRTRLLHLDVLGAVCDSCGRVVVAVTQCVWSV